MERKTQLTATMNANGVIAGFNQITTGSRAMAAAAEEAGKRAGRGLGRAGEGAQEGAAKVDRATRTISNAYQRLIAEERALAAIGRSGDSAGNNAAFRAAVLEERARQIGANTAALQPYRKELEEARKANELLAQGMDKAGISARQTAAALRGVPAQFTDIVVSLQGGQNPFTVLLQQGGQLTDMFGGIGNAARAMGGFVAGLVTPFTAAAAVAVALVAAHEAGAGEARAYERALITTGNAAGVTSGQLEMMARSISSVRGTQMAAAEGLAEMVSAGAAGAQELQRYTQVALDWQRATGTAVGDTAKQFAELRKAPLEATLKLNESMGQMTASTYAQIKALVEQGRTTEAATVAQNAFADALEQRGPQMEQQLGTLQRGWLALKGVIGDVVDATLQVGRAPGLDAQLDAAQQRLATLQERAARGRFGSNEGGAAFGGANTRRNESAALAAAQAEVDALNETVRLARRSADEKARSVALGKAVAEWDKEGAKHLDEQTRLQNELNRARQLGLRAGQSEAAILERQNAIRAEYAKKGQGAVNDGINAQIEALQRQADIEDVITQRAQAQLQVRQQLGQISSRDAAAESTRLQVAAIDRQIAIEREALAIAGTKKTSLREQAEIQGRLDKLTQQRISAEIDGTNKLLLLDKQRADQIAAVRVAQAEELQEARARAATEALDKTNASLTAVRAYEAAIADVVQATELEVSLLGKTERQRNIILGQYRVERELQRQILGIKNLGLSAAEEEARIGELRVASLTAAANVANQVIVDESRKSADQINESLTDALMRGFEDGKGFAENMRDTIVNMFRTMVLRPVISAVVQPIGNAAAGVVSSLVGGGGGGSGMLGSLGGLGNAASLLGLGGTSFGSGLTMALNGGFSAALQGGLSMVGSATGLSSALAGIGQIAGALGPVALGIGALVALSGAFKGEKRAGGQYAYSFDGESVYNPNTGRTVAASGIGATFLQGPSGGELAGAEVRTAINATVTGINELLAGVGSSLAVTAFQAGVETSDKNRGGVFSGGRIGDIAFGETGQGDNYAGTLYETTSTRSLKAEDAPAAIALELQQAMVQALQAATDTPEAVRRRLAGFDAEAGTAETVGALLGEIAAEAQAVASLRESLAAMPFANVRDLSYDAAAGILQFAGGLDQLQQSQAGFLQNYFTQEEQRETLIARTSAAFESLGLVMPDVAGDADAARAAFRALAEGIDVTTESGQRQYAGVLALQGAFAELTPVIDKAAEAARKAEEALQQRQQLETQLLQLQGNTAELRARELAALDPSNQPLQQQIWALQDAQTASAAAAQAQAAIAQAQAAAADTQRRAADQVRSSWQSVMDAIAGSARSIADEMLAESPQARAYYEAQFASTTAAARAGDQAAAQQLPELSRTLAELVRESATSALDQRVQLSRLVASLLETNKAIGKRAGVAVPAFAAGGLHSGGYAIVGEQGPELAYMPPARIYTSGQTSDLMDTGALLDELRGLREEVRGLRADRARTAETINRLGSTVEDLSRNGFPVVNQPERKLATTA